MLELEHWILILGLIVFGWTLDIRSMAGTPVLTLISSLVAVKATLAVVVAKDLKAIVVMVVAIAIAIAILVPPAAKYVLFVAI